MRQHNIVKRGNLLGFIDLKVPANKSFSVFVDSLVNSSNVEHVIYSTVGEYVDFVPNDTELSSQWNLQKINAYKAWDVTTGSTNVIVSILDSGTDWSHSDLGQGNNSYQNIYLNTGEDAWSNQNNPSSGNGVDDDGNGLIDDWKGWNYATNTNDVRTSYYHGTFVAGIVGAKTNNNHGIAGIAGGKNKSGAKLLSYCVGINSPISSVIDDAIISAVNKGAKIIQFSLSIPQSDDIDAAIQYAKNHNVLIVCAAGNGNSNSVSYPASNDNVVAVGATTQSGERAPFSNYGTKLSVVAPGVDIYSTTLGNGYDISSGTSFAAPQVSAVAALVLSVNPNLTGQQVRDIIERTAQKVRTDLYSYSTTSNRSNGTWNNELGYGLVDAYAAVREAVFSLPPFISGPASINCNEVSFSINRSSCLYYEWTTSPGIEIVSGQETDSITVKGTSYNTNGWIDVFVVTGALTSDFKLEYFTLRKNITVNTPSSYNITGYVNVSNNMKKATLVLNPVPEEATLCNRSYWWKTTAGSLTVNSIIPLLSPSTEIFEENMENNVTENEITKSVVEETTPVSRIFGGGVTVLNNTVIQTTLYEQAELDFTGVTSNNITVSCYLTDPRLLNPSGTVSIASFSLNPLNFLYSASYSPSNRTIMLSRPQHLSSSEAFVADCQLQFHLYNDSGYIRTVEFSSNENTVSIPLGNLPAGNYYVNIVDCDGNVLERKAIPAY